MGAGKKLSRQMTQSEISFKPIIWRMMIPLIVTLSLLIIGFGTAMTWQHHEALEQSSSRIFKDALGELPEILNKQSQALAANEDILAREDNLREALKNNDRERLLKLYSPLFEDLKVHYAITHFYFHDSNRVNLLRIHKPEKYGDKIDRFTALEAERNGETASGVELGPLGTLTLRVVKPVYDNKELVGYLELGKEIEDALKHIHENTECQLVVLLHKDKLERKKWEAGMKMLNRKADWNFLSTNILTYSTLPSVPVELKKYLCRYKSYMRETADDEIYFNDTYWQIMTNPLIDATKNEVGNIVMMRDVSALKTEHLRWLSSTIIACIIILFILSAFTFALLRHTDAKINAQQSALNEESERNNILINQSKDAMMTLEPPTWEFTSGNQATIKMFGTKNLKAFIMLHPSDASPERQPDGQLSSDKSKEMIQTAMREGVNYFDWTHRRVDGTVFQAKVLLSRITMRGKRSLQATVRDITEQRKSDKKLIKAKNQIENMIRSSPLIMMSVDTDGRVISWNKEAENILGWKEEEIMGKNTSFLFANKDCAQPWDLFKTLPGNARKSELTLNTKGGDSIIVIITISLIKDANGRITGLLSIMDDITEEMEMKRKAVEAQELLEDKKMLLHRLGHDLKTPLTPLITLLPLLEKKLVQLNEKNLQNEDNSQIEKILDTCSRNASYMNNIIDHILQLIEYGRNTQLLVKKKINLSDTTENFLDDFNMRWKFKLEENDVNIKREIEKNVRILGNKNDLIEVFENLLSNAIKYGNQGGEITIKLETTNTYALVSVRDDGEGMNNETLDCLFDEFYKSDKSRTNSESSGLGLAICKKIIEMHHGETWAESQSSGTGSTIYFKLPRI